MNYLDRALYYTDRPAKAFKNGDALRKLIYASLVDLSCTDEQNLDVLKTSNDIFYLCAKLYVDDEPELNFHDKYAYCFDNSFREIAEIDKLKLNMVYVILSLQQSLPKDLAAFLPYFKKIVSQYSYYSYAEDKMKVWKSEYGLFKTDIAPNADLTTVLQSIDYDLLGKKMYTECDGYLDNGEVIEELHRNIEYIYPSFRESFINQRIRLFRNKTDQMMFIDKSFQQYFKYVFNFRIHSEGFLIDANKQPYLDRIAQGVYLPHYDFSYGTFPIENQTKERNDNKELEKTKLLCEHYQIDLKKKDEGIVKLKEENDNLKKQLQLQKVEYESATTLNAKKYVSLEQIKEHLIELDDYDDAKVKMTSLDSTGLLAETDWPKVEKEIRKYYRDKEKKEKGGSSVTIQGKKVVVNDVHDNNEVNLKQKK